MLLLFCVCWLLIARAQLTAPKPENMLEWHYVLLGPEETPVSCAYREHADAVCWRGKRSRARTVRRRRLPRQARLSAHLSGTSVRHRRQCIRSPRLCCIACVRFVVITRSLCRHSTHRRYEANRLRADLLAGWRVQSAHQVVGYLSHTIDTRQSICIHHQDDSSQT